MFFLAVFSLALCQATYAISGFNYDKRTGNIMGIRVYSVYHIGSTAEDLDAVKFPSHVDVGGLQYDRLEIQATTLAFFGKAGVVSVAKDIFSVNQIYEMRFSEDGKIFAIKTKGPSSDGPSSVSGDVIKTVMFYTPDGFPCDQITKLLKGNLGKPPPPAPPTTPPDAAPPPPTPSAAPPPTKRSPNTREKPEQ